MPFHSIAAASRTTITASTLRALRSSQRRTDASGCVVWSGARGSRTIASATARVRRDVAAVEGGHLVLGDRKNVTAAQAELTKSYSSAVESSKPLLVFASPSRRPAPHRPRPDDGSRVQ